MSGPPAFRGAKLEEMPGGSVMHIRQHSRDGSPDLGHSNKENDKPAERKESRGERPMSVNGSAVDSGVDTDVSFKLKFNIADFLHKVKMNLTI